VLKIGQIKPNNRAIWFIYHQIQKSRSLRCGFFVIS
jgi:hypothetical protein